MSYLGISFDSSSIGYSDSFLISSSDGSILIIPNFLKAKVSFEGLFRNSKFLGRRYDFYHLDLKREQQSSYMLDNLSSNLKNVIKKESKEIQKIIHQIYKVKNESDSKSILRNWI